jgi:hypothetical protein
MQQAKRGGFTQQEQIAWTACALLSWPVLDSYMLALPLLILQRHLTTLVWRQPRRLDPRLGPSQCAWQSEHPILAGQTICLRSRKCMQ